MRGVKAQREAQIVERQRRDRECIGEALLIGRQRRFGHRRRGGFAKDGKHVGSGQDELCFAALNEPVAARAGRVRGVPRQRKHLAVVVECQPSRKQGTARLERLGHHRAPRHPGDQTVALGEVDGVGLRAHRLFGEQRPGFGNALGQRVMPLGVDAVYAGAEHRDGSPARVERAFVGGGVDAVGQARNNRPARLGEVEGQTVGGASSGVGGAARPNHGHRAFVLREQRASHPEQRRRVVHRAQQRRKGVVGFGDGCCARPFGSAKLLVHGIPAVEPEQPHAPVGADAGHGGEASGGGAEGFGKRTEVRGEGAGTGRADAGQAKQRHEGAVFGRAYGGRGVGGEG